jgi:hypothetical protein
VGQVLSLGSGLAAAAMFGIGAAAGGATGGIVGALVGMDFPEEEARYYEKELKAGRVLVGVKSDRLDEAQTILSRNGGYDADSPRESAGEATAAPMAARM